MPDIFLSYNREDQATASRFAEGFERAGFNVWWDAILEKVWLKTPPEPSAA